MPFNHTWMTSGVQCFTIHPSFDVTFVHRSVLFQHFESPEEGTRNVVAECVGKLTLLEPQTLLPRLQVGTIYSKDKYNLHNKFIFFRKI